MKNNKSPLVSIVIPVYMVEKYLSICIQSVLDQTYINLEIILVNDGSTDDSGKICEQYQKIDERVHVVHKKNGGLSDARNVGARQAIGDYIFFLDSDDWLDLTCIEKLVEKVDDNCISVIQSNFYYSYEDYLLFDEYCTILPENQKELTKEMALELLIENRCIKNFAWGKLIPANIVKKFKFPKGRLFEDTFWTHHVLSSADSYVLVTEPLLFYRQREESISYTDFNVRNIDRLDGLEERRSFIDKNFPALNSKMLQSSLGSHMEMYYQAKSCKKNVLAEEIKKRFDRVFIENHLASKEVKFKVFYVSPFFYRSLFFIDRIKKYVFRKLKLDSKVLKRINLD